MKREDLFIAIGSVDDNSLAQCQMYKNPSVVAHWEDSIMKNEKYTRMPRPHRIRKVWLIAAIIALMLLMMGSAIVSLITMRVEKVKMAIFDDGFYEKETIIAENSQNAEMETPSENHKQESVYSGEIVEGEMISFGETADVFIELGNYYPQEIPKGYKMTFVSNDAPMQNRTIHYENDAGNLIQYWLYIGNPASIVEIYNIENKTDVQINHQSGILYEQKDGSRVLVWVDKTRGFGHAISADDPTVDMIAMAKSTAEGEPLVPTRSGETVKALEELGDYSPEILPEGFEELDVQGSPLSEGGNWYSYIRKWYVNKAENTGIYFEYETYRIVTEEGYTDNAETACSFLMPKTREGEIIGAEVEINGMSGFAGENDIVWADPEAHKVFHLYSEDVTGDELLQIAQSVSSKH